MDSFRYIAAMSKKYPNAWRMAEEMRADRGVKLDPWPAWCYLPMAGWYAIVSSQLKMKDLPLEAITDVQLLYSNTFDYSAYLETVIQ